MATKFCNYDTEFKNQVIAVYKRNIYVSVSTCAVAYNLLVFTVQIQLQSNGNYLLYPIIS